MKITIFEGTTEEYKAVASHLGNNIEVLPEGDEEKISSEKAYRAMLQRREIDQGQRDMYKILAGGELPWVEYNTRMNRSASQIRGVHGALGRRINGTPEIHEAGLPGDTSAVMYWNGYGKIIGLKPDFVQVLKELKIV